MMSIRFPEVFSICLPLVMWNVSVESAEIVFFNGMGEGSHFSAAAALGVELSSRGHSITFLVSSEFKHLKENPTLFPSLEFIVIKSEVQMLPFYEQMTQAKFEGVDLFWNRSFVAELTEAQTKECRPVFYPTFLQNLKERKFDLLIVDPWWSCCVALGENLGVKKVVLNPASLSPMFLRAFGSYVNPALIREYSTGFPETMSFFQRMQNVLLSYNIPVGDHKAFNDALANVPGAGFNGLSSYLDGLINADLFISSSDPLLYPDMSERSGIISAAGLTAKEARRLSEEQENFMRSSKENGVILYSLGTYLTHLPNKYVEIFQQVFAMLPQNVIWQWKDQRLPSNITQNVRMLKWIPQNDILGHNKTKLMICHGGNNGFHEAIYHAVPLLVIPLGGDQYDVAQKVVEKEIGLKLDVTSVTVNSMYKAIGTLLTDKRYQTNINKISTLFRDRPQSPREKAAFWIEHVLKYGSEHFHLASRELNIWQKNLIDVHVFLLAVTCLSIAGGILILQYIFKVAHRLLLIEKGKVD